MRVILHVPGGRVIGPGEFADLKDGADLVARGLAREYKPEPAPAPLVDPLAAEKAQRDAINAEVTAAEARLTELRKAIAADEARLAELQKATAAPPDKGKEPKK